MVQNDQSINIDAIADCVMLTLRHLEYSQKCTELLKLMIDMLECPELGSPTRLKIISEQIEVMWLDSESSITKQLERLTTLCDPPRSTPKPVIKSSSRSGEL
jgi:hypothetical protein